MQAIVTCILLIPFIQVVLIVTFDDWTREPLSSILSYRLSSILESPVCRPFCRRLVQFISTGSCRRPTESTVHSFQIGRLSAGPTGQPKLTVGS